MTVSMHHTHRVTPGPRRLAARLRGAARAVTGLAIAAAAVACDLNTTQPDIALPGTLAPPGALPTVAAGGVSDFAGALGGFGNASEGAILLGGLLADEWIQSDYFEEHAQIENRNMVNRSNYAIDSLVRHLHRSRVDNEFVANRYEELEVVDAGRARALNLAGFSYVLLAEHFCGGVPLSTYDASGKITYGPQVTTAQLLDSALVRFDAALAAAQAVGEDDAAAEQILVAAVGKGRALLNQGKYADAAAAVADVPTDFAYTVEYSANTDRERLGVYDWSASQSRFSLADLNGTNGLPFRSAEDPRLPWEDAGLSVTDGTTELFIEKKYGAPDASVPLATGIEARLIEAEAALQANDLVTFRSMLNEARSQFAGLDPLGLTDIPAGADARVDLLFYERGFDLALTAHRLGDMRRLARDATAELGGYGRGVENVFPVGESDKGQPYGDDVAFPMPLVEQNNPNFNAAQCDATQP